MASAAIDGQGVLGDRFAEFRNLGLVLGDAGTAAAPLGDFSLPLSVGLIDQSAHPNSQVLGFAVPERAAGAVLPGGAFGASSMNQLIESQPTASGGQTVLQVRGVAVTGTGLRVRFNQPIDLARLARQAEADGALRSSQIVILRGDQVVRGLIVPDPDGAGFSFVPDSGPLPRGEYSVVLRSRADGFVNLRGELLDGNYDGVAGGDYRARFSVETVLPVRAERLAPAAPSASPVDPMLQQSTGAHFVADPTEGVDGTELLNTLLGGFGGMSMLAASLGPWGAAVPKRRNAARATPAARRRAAAAPADAPRVRTERPADGIVSMPLAQPAPRWVAGWVDRGAQRGNDWRIKL